MITRMPEGACPEQTWKTSAGNEIIRTGGREDVRHRRRDKRKGKTDWQSDRATARQRNGETA